MTLKLLPLIVLSSCITITLYDHKSKTLSLVLKILRRNIEKGLTCGNDDFIENLEKLSAKGLSYRPQGRPSIKV